MYIRAFQPADEDAVISLWKSCDLLRSWNNPEKTSPESCKCSPSFFWSVWKTKKSSAR